VNTQTAPPGNGNAEVSMSYLPNQPPDAIEHGRIVVEHARLEIVDPDERVARDASVPSTDSNKHERPG